MPLPKGTSAIRGSLTDARTKEPVAGCTVRAGLVSTGPTAAQYNNAVDTGADGTYEFNGITEGDYFVRVECPFHLFTFACPPGKDPAGAPCGSVPLFKDQQSTFDFALTPEAKVRGRVVDSAGKPVPKAIVKIGGSFGGNSVLYRVTPVETKDDGTFEIEDMAEGAWYLEADIPPPPGTLRSPAVYYPGVLKRDEAEKVEVAEGKVKEGVIITIPPVLDRTLTVRIPPPDSSVTDLTVSLIRAEPLMTRRLDVDAEGQAIVTGLIDGRYVALATGVYGQQRWADFQTIDFLDASYDATLQPKPTGRIRGKIVAKDGVVPLDDASIGAAWVDNDVVLNPLTPEEAKVSPDGTFEIKGVFGRRVVQLLRFDPSWRIESVLQGKTDITASGIDVASGGSTEVTVIVRRR